MCQLFLHEFWHGLKERFLIDFRQFRGACGRLFGSLFRPKRENGKVCLDCTGVCGLHIQLSGKCTFLQFFPPYCLKPCAGGHFDSILVFLGLLEAPSLAPLKKLPKLRVTVGRAEVPQPWGRGGGGVRSWGCGPLKTRQSDHQTLDRTRPGVPGGTVADIRRRK